MSGLIEWTVFGYDQSKHPVGAVEVVVTAADATEARKVAAELGRTGERGSYFTVAKDAVVVPTNLAATWV